MADQDPFASIAAPVQQDPFASIAAPLSAPKPAAAAPLPNAGLAPAAGAPPSPTKAPSSGEGPLAQGMTSFENRLSQMPGQAAGLIKQSWMDKPQPNQPTVADQLLNPRNLNPVVTSEGSLPRNIGATAANLLPLAVSGEGISESPLGVAAKGAGSLAEGAGGIVKGAAKASGIGLTPIEKLVKAAGPSVRDVNFPQRLETAAPEIARQNAVSPIKSVQDMSDAAHTAANNLWTQRIEPQITRNASQTIDGSQVANGIRNGIDPGSRDLFPEQAAKAEDLASKFDGPLTLKKSNDYLKTLNAQLKGFYKMSPEARAAAGVTDGRISSMEDAANGLRQQMYSKLDSLGETDPAGLRQQYGALKDVQSVFGKRAIVAGRQAPMNLQQILAAAAGAGEATGALASGHPMAALGGVVGAATPTILKYFNSPDMLAQRGVRGLEMPPPVPPEPVPTPGIPRSLGAAAAAPAEAEVPGALRERVPGTDRRAVDRSTMSANELEAAIKNRGKIRTPFDYTEDARQTMLRDQNTLGSEEAQRGRAAEVAQKYPGQRINPIRDPFAAPEQPVTHNMITDASGKPDRLEIMKGNQPLGHLKIEEQIPGTWTVKDAVVNQPGKGYGSSAYKQLISEAQKAGVKTIESDISNTSGAAKTWRSLQREFPNAVTEENGQYSMDTTKLKK